MHAALKCILCKIQVVWVPLSWAETVAGIFKEKTTKP